MQITIKTWEDLITTPGTIAAYEGYVNNDTFFNSDIMKQFCGETIEVRKCRREDVYTYTNGIFYFADWMISSKEHNFNSLYGKLIQGG